MNVQFNPGLPAGNFVAMTRDTQRADLRIYASKDVGYCAHMVSADRIVELSENKLLQIKNDIALRV